jgi:HK97 family phage major capsid protein
LKHYGLAAFPAGSFALARPRAICGVGIRADMSDPNKVLAALQESVEEFKKTLDDKLKGKADVVLNEKVERIDTAIGNFQAIIDDVNARLAAAQVGAGQQRPISPEERQYADDFKAWLIGNGNESAVQAAQKKGIRAAMSEGTNTAGGYFTPIEWDRTIIDRLKLVSPIRSISQVQSTTKRGWTKLLNDRNVGSGWVGETAARPQTTNPGLVPLQFVVGEIYAMPAATQDLLDDAEGVNLQDWLAGEVELEFSRQEGIAFVGGDGVNKPNGLLTYTDNTIHPWGPIATVVSGNAALLTQDGIINLVNDLPSAFVPNARFIANRKTIGAVRKFKDAQGNYQWQPSLQLGTPQTLLGYPITEVPDMPDIAANSIPAMFGDFQRGYLVIDRMGVRVLRDPYSNKPYVLFYTTKRVGGGVQNPEVLRYLKVSA